MSIKRAAAFAGFAFFVIVSAGAGGLSSSVANRAGCDDMLAQCLQDMKRDIPCSDESSEKCYQKRLLATKQCNFLHNHCLHDDQPVKRAAPVKPGRKEH